MATDPHQHEGSHDHHGAGVINHETTDISLDMIGRLIIGFVVILVVVLGAMYASYRMLDRRATALDVTAQRAVDTGMAARAGTTPGITEAPNVMETAGRAAAGPELLTNEPAWLAGVKANQRQALTTYGWVNKEAGTVHLPIERAKQLLVERGLPVTAPADEAPADAAPVDAEAPPAEAAPPVQP